MLPKKRNRGNEYHQNEKNIKKKLRRYHNMRLTNLYIFYALVQILFIKVKIGKELERRNSKNNTQLDIVNYN